MKCCFRRSSRLRRREVARVAGSGPRWRFCLIGVLALAGESQPVLALQTTATLRLNNDFFNFWQAPSRRPDKEYTQGAELTLRWPSSTRLLHWMRAPAPRCEPRTPAEVLCSHVMVSLGQDMYTPSVDSPQLLPGQRPYAGWLYLALTEQAENARRMDALRFTVGVTGPPSLAEAFQRAWHDTFGYRKPLGWSGQLPFEPAVALSYSGGRLLSAPGSTHPGLAIAPTWSVTAGTLLTGMEVGVRATFGSHSPPPWTPTARRNVGSGTGVYLLAAAQGELVAHNLFLDGTLFRSSPSVDRRWLVGQVEGGIGLTLGRVRLEWAVVHRAREYRTQPAPHTYARIQLGWD